MIEPSDLLKILLVANISGATLTLNAVKNIGDYYDELFNRISVQFSQFPLVLTILNSYKDKTVKTVKLYLFVIVFLFLLAEIPLFNTLFSSASPVDMVYYSIVAFCLSIVFLGILVLSTIVATIVAP
jgi:hypothetical protein